MSQYSDYRTWLTSNPLSVEELVTPELTDQDRSLAMLTGGLESYSAVPSPEPYAVQRPSDVSYVTAPLYNYAQQYADQVGATQEQLDEVLGDYGRTHRQMFGGWSDQDSAAPAALAWSAFAMNGAENGINPSDLELLQKSTHEDPAWMSQLNNAIAYGNQKAAANHNSGGFGDLLGPLAMMAAMYVLGPAAGGLGELAAADMAAGLIPASELSAMGVGTGALSDMGFTGMNLAGPETTAMGNWASAPESSFLDQAKNLYGQVKPGLDAFGNIKKGVNLAQQLIGTGDAKNMNQSVSGLQQYQTQSQQGTPSRAFGLNNYNSVRG